MSIKVSLNLNFSLSFVHYCIDSKINAVELAYDFQLKYIDNNLSSNSEYKVYMSYILLNEM